MEVNEYPLVSFFIVSYNEEKYIREAVQAAFDQDYPNLEIILSDDNSPDNTFEIVKKMAADYKGPHRVILNQNKPNLGPRDHYCKVLYELCHGEFIIFADGDDISDPTRTKFSVDFLMSHPEVMSLSFESRHIDAEGNEIENKFSNSLSTNQYSIYTLDDFVTYELYNLSDDSRAIRRSLIDAFPPLRFSYSEDIFLFIRSMFLGSYAYIRKPLVSYRQHPGSIMNKSRSKLFVRKKDFAKFENTSARQIREDFTFAIEHNFITPDAVDVVRKKIEKTISYLSPKRQYNRNRIARRIIRFISNYLDL